MKIIVGLLAATSVSLIGCGGASEMSVKGNSANTFTIESGVAQKGPLAQGSDVFVSELTATTYQPNGKTYPFATNNNWGTFTPSGITYSTPYLSTLALGYYYNEITGAQSDDMVNLRGLSQIGVVSGTAADKVINVNALSSMAVNRITTLATTAPVRTFAAARAQAQKETLGAFYIYNGTSILTGTTVSAVAQPANLTALDLSKNRAGDQMLAAVSALVMTAGVNGAGVNALLSQIANDLADDGVLNNSTNYKTNVQSVMCAAAASTDFAKVAANLNAFYGTNYQAIDLSQWVDTSGCADQVIDKYKFTANNVPVGIVSKSPLYIAGPDDVGQCFSVGGLTAGATGGLYYKGANITVVGTQVVKLGDSLTIGINASTTGIYSGFIQRSAPINGTCPKVAPITGLTRVSKYSITVPDTYTFDLTNRVAQAYPEKCTNKNFIAFEMKFLKDGLQFVRGTDSTDDGPNGTCIAKQTKQSEVGMVFTYAGSKNNGFIPCGGPVCTFAQLNATYTGIDVDGRVWTGVVSHIKNSNEIVFTKSWMQGQTLQGGKVTLKFVDDGYVIDLTSRSGSVYALKCTPSFLAYKLGFKAQGLGITEGTDSVNLQNDGSCIRGEPIPDLTSISPYADAKRNGFIIPCGSAICTGYELNLTYTGTGDDGLPWIQVVSHAKGSKVILSKKSWIENNIPKEYASKLLLD